MNQYATKIARTGTGILQWTPGGWFGGNIGASSWLAYGAFALAFEGQSHVSTVSALSWLLILALTFWLWTRRDRFDPFNAFAIVLLALSFVMPIVWFVCWDIPTDRLVPSLYWLRGVRAVAACSIAPLILLGFFMRERFGKKKTIDSVSGTWTGEV